MTNKPTSGVALIGAGMSAQSIWLPALQGAGLVVCAVIDPSDAAKQRLRPHVGEAIFFDDLTGLALENIDVAIVASPNRFHVAHGCFCLSHKVPVVIEKPVCFSLQDANRLVQESEDNDTPFWCSAASAFRGDIMHIKNLIRNGDLGDIFSISLSWRRAQGIPRPGSWFTDKDMAIGGSGADLGWHLLDVGLGFLAYPEVLCGHSRAIPFFADTPHLQQSWYDATHTPGAAVQNTVFSVENEMLAALTTSDCDITLSTAWASHQRFDTTEITLRGSKAEVALSCTFGFSPNGIRHSFLTVTKEGKETRTILSETQKIDPYIRFAQHIGEELSCNTFTRTAQAQKLRSLSSAMQILYPKT